MIASYYSSLNSEGGVLQGGTPTTPGGGGGGGSFPNVTNLLIPELGQSNMEGRDGDTANGSYPFTSSNGYWFNGTTQFDIVTTRGNAEGGSHANYFCERFYTLKAKKAIMLEASEGGSGLTTTSQSSKNWSSSGALRGNAQTLISQALTHYNESTPYCALWCQGERDAQEMDSNGAYTKSIVKAAMQDVIDWWFNLYPDAPFVISETGDMSPYNNTQGWQDMRAIQNELAAENAKVYVGFTNAKNFGAQGKMKADGLHYNYIGYQEMGEALATFIAGI